MNAERGVKDIEDLGISVSGNWGDFCDIEFILSLREESILYQINYQKQLVHSFVILNYVYALS